MMKKNHHPHLHHQPPDWVNEPIYFITVCAEERGGNQLCGESGKEILRAIEIYHKKQRWYCHLALLMPDHVHFLLSFGEIPSYAKIVGDWKRWISRHHSVVWQENFFEHRLRKEESFARKADYILHNPVRAGLVFDWKVWPYRRMR